MLLMEINGIHVYKRDLMFLVKCYVKKFIHLKFLSKPQSSYL